MKKLLYPFFAFLIISCNSKTSLEEDFKCNNSPTFQLETVKDMKNVFTLELPVNWKTNLFYDNVQSSIYTADTTKQLTETTILDVTLIQNSVNFNEVFRLNFEQSQLQKKLIVTKSESTTVLTKSSYYFVSKGKKNNFPYQSLDVYIQMNESNFILAKAEVYGDSLVEKRLCEAVNLIEKIKLQ